MKTSIIRKFIILLLLIADICICSESLGNNGQRRVFPDRKPNVIIIMSDDQGWGDLSIHGNPNLATPNIDAIAKNGVTFVNFFTSPVCSPTRAEFLTGRYHVRSGVYDTSAGGERLDLDETTIADVFKGAGYSTGAFGKWHNGMQYPYHPNARGFDEFYGFCSGHWGDYYSPQLEHNGKLVKGNGFIADDLTDRAIEFVDRNKSNPFFLYVPYNTPHSPMQVPDRFWNKFKDKKIDSVYAGPEPEDIVFTRAALAMCENIDWNVGRLLEKVKALNLERNTIILYLSDNGPNSWRWNGRMKGRKGSTNEGGVRSPLFIAWPGKIKSGMEIKHISSTIDLLPTLTDLAGIEYQPTKPIDGKSLVPLLRDEDRNWEERLVFNYWNSRVSVRSQRYRLDDQGKLFDMESDPGQLTDITRQEPDVSKWLTAEAEKWKGTVATELPGVDSRPFPVSPDAKYTQIPARDGVIHGNIKRSNRFPNASFFTNWTSVDDSITWDVEATSDGNYEVTLYYTCPKKDIGSSFALSFGKNRLISKISKAHDPPLIGMQHDRVKRQESYVKDFKPLRLGVMPLQKGRHMLTLKALDIPGSQVMDFRLLMFTRVKE